MLQLAERLRLIYVGAHTGYDTVYYEVYNNNAWLPQNKDIYIWSDFTTNQYNLREAYTYNQTTHRYAGYFKDEVDRTPTLITTRSYGVNGAGRFYIRQIFGQTVGGLYNRNWSLSVDTTTGLADTSTVGYAVTDAAFTYSQSVTYTMGNGVRRVSYGSRVANMYYAGGALARATNFSSPDGIMYTPTSRTDYEDYRPYTATAPILAAGQLLVLPNPAHGYERISLPGQHLATIKLINMAGQTVLTQQGNGTEVLLDLRGVPQGLYTAVVHYRAEVLHRGL